MSQDKAEFWFSEGPPNREKFMVIATDTFDGGVYPVFTNDPEGKITELRRGLNQVMEVYNLDKPLDLQNRRAALFYHAAWDLGEDEGA